VAEKTLLEELDLAPRTRGRPATEVYIAYERDLTEADVAALAAPKGVKPKSLVRIHASHHALARCLAAGMRPAHAALVTGYSSSRISILQQDQAFMALVSDYQAEARAAYADLGERMNNLSLDAIELLQERLHEFPEGFSIPMLLDLVRTFADRTGHGPNQELTLKMDQNLIDRPPKETFEQWEERRRRELSEPVKIN